MSRRPMVAPYVTLGEEDTVTFEAEAAAQGFEDVNSTATLRLLQKTMRKEETALLGGNTSRRARHARRADSQRLRHGRDAAVGDLFGHRRRAHLRRLSQFLGEHGHRHHQDDHRQRRQHLYDQRRLFQPQRQHDAGRNARARPCSPRSAIVNGAVSYAWFVGPAGSETLQAITSINSVAFSAPLTVGPAAREHRSPPTIRAIRRSPSTGC